MTSVPVRPVLICTSAIFETRFTSSPTRSGLMYLVRAPPNMRRGSGTGGMKPPRAGWPSGPICEAGTRGWKKHPCAIELGRASLRELVCPYVLISVGAAYVPQKDTQNHIVTTHAKVE